MPGPFDLTREPDYTSRSELPTFDERAGFKPWQKEAIAQLLPQAAARYGVDKKWKALRPHLTGEAPPLAPESPETPPALAPYSQGVRDALTRYQEVMAGRPTAPTLEGPTPQPYALLGALLGGAISGDRKVAADLLTGTIHGGNLAHQRAQEEAIRGYQLESDAWGQSAQTAARDYDIARDEERRKEAALAEAERWGRDFDFRQQVDADNRYARQEAQRLNLEDRADARRAASEQKTHVARERQIGDLWKVATDATRGPESRVATARMLLTILDADDPRATAIQAAMPGLQRYSPAELTRIQNANTAAANARIGEKRVGIYGRQVDAQIQDTQADNIRADKGLALDVRRQGEVERANRAKEKLDRDQYQWGKYVFSEGQKLKYAELELSRAKLESDESTKGYAAWVDATIRQIDLGAKTATERRKELRSARELYDALKTKRERSRQYWSTEDEDARKAMIGEGAPPPSRPEVYDSQLASLKGQIEGLYQGIKGLDGEVGGLKSKLRNRSAERMQRAQKLGLLPPVNPGSGPRRAPLAPLSPADLDGRVAAPITGPIGGGKR